MTTFADILGQPRQVQVAGFHEPVTYRPDALTPGLLTRLITEVSSGDPLRGVSAYRDALPAFIASWDLVDKGQPVPLTPDGIDAVPLEILDLVFVAIMQDREQRRSEEGNASSASTAEPPPASTTPSSTESPRNGSDLSQPLASTALAPGSS